LDPQKIQAITKWIIPKSIKSLRGFLGLIGYYCKFVKNFACITGPLTSLLNKKSFVWNEEATLTFSLLMDIMSSTPILATPYFGKTFIIECDALEQGIRAILIQEGKPLAFESKQLKGKDLVKSNMKRNGNNFTCNTKWQRHLLEMNFKVKESDDRAYPSHVQLQAPTHMG
jgi:hypothetical protein